jgi:hypothetical protein
MMGFAPPPWETSGLDPLHSFRTRLAPLRSFVTSILRSETASGDLRFVDEGIAHVVGGVWLTAVWRPHRNLLTIGCAQGTFDTWRVAMNPLKPDWPARVLRWPSDDFEAELRAVVAMLRMNDTGPGVIEGHGLPQEPTT